MEDFDPTLWHTRWSDLRVLITGGGGFIGSHLCRRLCEMGSEVHATSRSERVTTPGGPVWWQADMADVSTVRHLLDSLKPNIVYHLAGSVGASPSIDLVLPTYHSLLTSTVNLLVSATEAGCHRIVLSGSFTEPQPGEMQPTPWSPYAAAKWAGSGYGRMFHRLFHSPVVILQPFMVYGPAQAPSKLIPAVTQSLIKGEAPRISSGRRRADWVYIDDVVKGFLAAAAAPGIEGATIDLGSGTLVSIRAIVELLVALFDHKVEPVFDALLDRPGENEIAANTAVASAMLGWRAHTALESGLRETVAWYKSAAQPNRT